MIRGVRLVVLPTFAPKTATGAKRMSSRPVCSKIVIAILVATAANVVVTRSASAESLRKPVRRAPVVLPYSWTGWYVGGNLGYGWGGNGTVDPRATGFETGLFTPEFVAAELAGLASLNTNPKGLIGGVQAGYNYQANRVVLGIEADYSGTNIAGSKALISNTALAVDKAFGVTTNFSTQEKLNSLVTIRGRLGIIPFDRGLLYATGGFALGDATSGIAISQTETGPTPCVTITPSSGSASKTLTGWSIGGGGEWAFASNWSAKAEYLHYDLGALSYPANQIANISCPTSNPPSTPFAFVNPAPSAQFKGDIVRFGVNFKFGGP